jgi:hypothetical protein
VLLPLAQMPPLNGYSIDDLVSYAVIGVAVVLVLYVVLRILLAGRRKTVRAGEATLDLRRLGDEGPPAGGEALTVYHVPVRLAAIVLASSGRDSDLPPLAEQAETFDAIVPGLARIAAAHQTLVCRWPSQLSSRGFIHKFFSYIRLPGEGGKESAWCAVAGAFKLHGQSLMAGLLMRAAGPTSLGQAVIEKQHQWLDVIRIKS